MEESFSTVIPVSAVKPVSLQPWNSSPRHEDLYCMNMRPRSDLSSTYDINSSTSQAKSDHYINSDSVWLPEVSSSSDINENHECIDLNLTLDLTLRVNQADGNRIAPQPSPPTAGGMEQETMVAARDFQLQTVNRRENNNDIYSVSRDMANAEFGFERNCHEAIVGQARTVQCSASVTSKENQQEIPMINWNEAKHLAISSNISRQTRSFATNHSGMTLLDGFSNLSQDKVLQLSNFDPNLTDNDFADADHCSNSTIEDRVRCWSPIRANQRNSLCPFPNPSGENQQGAMAGRFVQGQGNSLYVKVNMDGMPIGRKLDLNAYESYETLAQDLKNMFQLTTENYIEACLPMAKNPAVKPLTLLDPTADFVLTYEDNEGDCMFVGDVPWKMFLRTVKRLRILKSSGSNAFAKKCSKKGKAT